MEGAPDESEPESGAEPAVQEPPLEELPPSGNCRRSCVVVGLLLAGLLVASGYSLDATRSQRISNAVREVEEAGLQVSDLHLAPSGPNGADDLRAAAGIFNKLPDDVAFMYGVDPVTLAKALKDPSSEDGQLTYTRELPSSPATLKKALTLFVGVVDQIAPQIEEGLSKEVVWAADFETKGFEAEFDFVTLNELGGALIVRAGARMIEGDASGAYADLELSLALAKTAKVPTIMGRLVRNSRLDQCLFLFEGLLSLGPPPPPEQRARILEALRDFRADFGLTRLLLGELHSARLLPDSPRLEEFPKEHQGLRARFLYGSWRASYVELLAKCALASRQQPREVHRFLNALRQEEGAGPYCEGLVTSLPKIEARNREALGRLRIAIRAIELLDLPELPKSVADLPYDACLLDQRRCNYRLDADRAVIWSVGPDTIDQAGVPAHESDGASDDQPFRIPRRKR